jgi:hypothetical protein
MGFIKDLHLTCVDISDILYNESKIPFPKQFMYPFLFLILGINFGFGFIIGLFKKEGGINE